MNTAQAKIVIEAALLSAQQPMTVGELRRLFDDELAADTVRVLLDELRADWSERGVRLVPIASGWRFQTAPEFAPFIERIHPEKPPRYSRAVTETLAIIAYRQPVTRGDIEEIRGVAVSSQVVKTLEERGWIEVIGHKDVLGRPELLGTTRQFLDDMGLRSLTELPPLTADGEPAGGAVPAQVAMAFDNAAAAQAGAVPADFGPDEQALVESLSAAIAASVAAAVGEPGEPAGASPSATPATPAAAADPDASAAPAATETSPATEAAAVPGSDTHPMNAAATAPSFPTGLPADAATPEPAGNAGPAAAPAQDDAADSHPEDPS